MKNLILRLFAVAALAFAGVAYAATPETSPIALGSALTPRTQTVALTNVVPLSTAETTLVGSAVDIREWRNVSLQVSFNSPTAGTTNVAFVFVRSGKTPAAADFETTPTLTWNVPANGTTTVVAHTNLPLDTIAGAAYIKLKSVTAGWNGCSNLTVTVTRKR